MTFALRFALWVAIGVALYLSLMPAPPAIPGLPTDPVKHAVGWACLTLLSSMAHRKLPTLHLILLLAFGNLATEVLQGLAHTGRNADVLDWSWGVGGTLVVAGLGYVAALLRSNETKHSEANLGAQIAPMARETVPDEASS